MAQQPCHHTVSMIRRKLNAAKCARERHLAAASIICGALYASGEHRTQAHSQERLSQAILGMLKREGICQRKDPPADVKSAEAHIIHIAHGSIKDTKSIKSGKGEVISLTLLYCYKHIYSWKGSIPPLC